MDQIEATVGGFIELAAVLREGKKLHEAEDLYPGNTDNRTFSAIYCMQWEAFLPNIVHPQTHQQPVRICRQKVNHRILNTQPGR